MRVLGVPYSDAEERDAAKLARAQAERIATEAAETVKDDKLKALADKEITALVAYLQRLGTDIKNRPPAADKPAAPVAKAGAGAAKEPGR